MAKKRRKKQAVAAPVQTGPKPPRRPWEWITIGSTCVIVGVIMMFARSGRVVPLPADHKGAEPTVAAMNAPDMRVYGVFTLVMGLAMGALAAYQWKHPVPDDDAEA